MIDTVKELLCSSNFWVLNKTVVKIFGLESAFLLVNMAEAESLLADEDGWFYQTIDTLEEITGFSRYQQEKCIKNLTEKGVLVQVTKGLPAKRYFKFDYQKLENWIVVTNKKLKNLQTRNEKIYELDVKEFTTNKESINKENNIKKGVDTQIIEKPYNSLDEIKPLLTQKKKNGREKKIKDMQSIRDMVLGFTNEESVRKKLNEYLDFRSTRGLQPNQWKIILDDLKTFCGNDTVLMIEKINGAIAGGYMQIIASWEKKPVKRGYNDNLKHTTDTWANMTKEERDANLVRDENGKIIEF